MIGRGYTLVSAQSFAAGPAGCLDWMMVMREAKVIFPLTITTSVLGRPKTPCAFNDLWSLVQDKA